MSEFNYLTGRPELFKNAPDAAMVVLEHDDGRMFYAVAHDLGANYWNEDGTPGSKIGLIALHKKTRVIASRSRIGGLPKVEPKRDPIPKSRLDRMQNAQNGLKKAISQPVPVTPKPERKPQAVKIEPPRLTPNLKLSTAPVVPDGANVTREQVEQIMRGYHNTQTKLTTVSDVAVGQNLQSDAGFVSVYELSQRGGSRATGTFITINGNGQLSMSARLPFVTGDNIDIQIDPTRGLIRLGKVTEGGRPLAKTRMVSFKVLCDLFRIPEGEKSVRIYLTETNGWWQGQAELAEVRK